jgi:uncharacterized cupin superfamily protein
VTSCTTYFPRSFTMPVLKSFRVFGDPVEINADGANGTTLNAGTQTCQPGGGPPPHLHLYEDEFFLPVYGKFEMFDGDSWTPLTTSGHFAGRGTVHTFRNCGQTEGKISFICTPGRFPEYMELISTLSLPQDMQKLVDLSAGYGITFVFPGVPQPTSDAPELALA